MCPASFCFAQTSRRNDCLRLTGDDHAEFAGGMEYSMRRVLAVSAMLGMAASAHAADLPDYLRGSFTSAPPIVNWRGFYVGGQGAWAYSAQTFNGSTIDHSLLSNTIGGNVIGEIRGIAAAPVPLGTTWRGSAGYGAFGGYNWQWDEVVVGLEGSYLHGNFGGSVSASKQFSSSGNNPSGTLSDGLIHEGTITSSSAISITDYATFRARAAYAFGSFLPYAFAGFTLGYANVSTSVRIDDSEASPGGPFTSLPPLIGSSTGVNHVIHGYTGGLGVDVNLISNLFLRAEWEYVRFTTQVDTNVNTVRAGLGYKF
jgi:outer membrane immunogenic protein